MGRRHVVTELNEEQLDFVIRQILDGKTDREICLRFEKVFEESEVSLAKSSLHRWRTTAGKELIERYQLARFQAKQLAENLGIEDADRYQTVISNIEDQLLTATRDVIKSDPIKLLNIRQEEERLRFKREELELKKEQVALEREKLRGVTIDKVKLGVEFLQDFMEFVGDSEAGIAFLTRNLKPFGEFLKGKYEAQTD